MDPRGSGGRSSRRYRRTWGSGSGWSTGSEADSGSCSQGAPPLTLYVDDCHWWFRERRWCHLVSDESLRELHEFAASLGVPERAFHGDHYDLPEERRVLAVESGAVEVSSRELVRRLRSSGLRVSATVRRATTRI
jgi:hypothetical protein